MRGTKEAKATKTLWPSVDVGRIVRVNGRTWRAGADLTESPAIGPRLGPPPTARISRRTPSIMADLEPADARRCFGPLAGAIAISGEEMTFALFLCVSGGRVAGRSFRLPSSLHGGPRVR
jgi:hypothetical protein